MSTVAQNTIVRSVAPKSLFEGAKVLLDATVSYNQGDLIAVASGLLKAVTASTDAPNFLGVAKQTVVLGKVKSPYQGTDVDASQAIEEIAGPVYGVVARVKLKAADAFAVGCVVYLSSVDAQTVTSVNPGTSDPIGIYQGAAVASATSGQVGEVLIGARFGLGYLAI